ncbi:MAG: hypothetical protein A2600_05410 [Candidatus Lambdaproteobacteria bacterium RIFOXYD1_FULL_56_27]|uniref:phosphoglycolate phosphatase n=1 Tax=Candidatus Lambdaproteobacteria bacterium RIFOXYD2_FULL_56_26 TaxID=1817773 RepID=A0A1F6GRE6_9PROT|nr:MAG: hypothetical protein A2426_10620 [Candidatus Lambdaproteobacteria bacterium RIFOXYC1_FULL_56_13]OGH00639.1 MAG: hypothetical protein A2557_03115 [Candidatus Lambdaproteobacteria bacterium RIFOXYD2_FULL_56_26]OGH07805.1 MAG: hypothetical protein A2600_05410 [Candidatus Lambdaproteobacteria bacterium RIFOXYD1_FULL_56_27]
MDLLRFKLHLFDLDDTLLQTRAAYYAAQEYAVDQLFEAKLLPGREEAYGQMRWFSKRIGSVDPAAYMTAFLKNLDLYSQENLHYLLSCYKEAYWSDLKPYPGALAYLESLVVEGKRLGLVSNGKTSTQLKKVRSAGLERFFPAECRFISGDYDWDQKKPNPYMLELALERFGVTKEEAIYYGNTQDDVLAANLAGITSLLFGPEQIENNAPEIAKPDLQRTAW